MKTNLEVLAYEKWLDVTRHGDFFKINQLKEIYNDYLNDMALKTEHIHVTGGFENCHCNTCIEAVSEFEGYKKYDEYMYMGRRVYISSFCPLENCADIFVQEKGTGFCEWLNVENACQDLLVIR